MLSRSPRATWWFLSCAARWSGIIAVAAQRALASSLHKHLFDTVASAAGEPAVHEVLQGKRWLDAPAPSRLQCGLGSHTCRRSLQVHWDTHVTVASNVCAKQGRVPWVATLARSPTRRRCYSRLPALTRRPAADVQPGLTTACQRVQHEHVRAGRRLSLGLGHPLRRHRKGVWNNKVTKKMIAAACDTNMFDRSSLFQHF